MNLNTISLPTKDKATKNRKKPQKSKAMLQRKSSIQLKMLLESLLLSRRLMMKIDRSLSMNTQTHDDEHAIELLFL
jgi:hypothetical protein